MSVVKGMFMGHPVEVSRWHYDNSKNLRFGRVKSACSGFGRITTFGNKPYGPTHFGCGPGFPKIK